MESVSGGARTIEQRDRRPAAVQVEAVITDNRPITPDSRIVTLEIDGAWPRSVPGQFVHLQLGDGLQPFLRRPFSLLGDRPAPGGGATLSIMYAVIGQGTERLAAMTAGTRLELLGPLGNGFLPDAHESWILVAGGRGAAPLFRVLESMADADAAANGGRPDLHFLFGARSREHLWGLDRLSEVTHHLATDDGSHGVHGTVVDLLEATLGQPLRSPVVLACGPEAMLAAIARVADRAGVPAQVSLESVMGCGCGLCRGCVVPRRVTTASPWRRDGNATYATVCKEGPVFLGSEVDWDAMPEI